MADVIVTTLRLMGQTAYVRGMHAASTATQRLGTTSTTTGTHVETLGTQAKISGTQAANYAKRTKSSAVAVAALGAAARYARSGTALLGAATGGALFQGIRFNATMESMTVRMEAFTGSARVAHAQMRRLEKLNKRTPFELPDLVAANTQLLAMGFSVRKSLRWTKQIADAVSGVAGGRGELDRAVYAIQNIATSGNLLTEDFRQLTNLGVTSYRAMAKALPGIDTVRELREGLKKGQISSGEALKAIGKDWGMRFPGLARKMSKTAQGQWSNMKDAINKELGKITFPLFDLLRTRVMPWITTNLPRWGAAFRRFGRDLHNALKPAAPFLESVVIPALKATGWAILELAKVALPVIRRLSIWLGAVTKAAQPLGGVFKVIGAAALVATNPLVRFTLVIKGVTAAANWAYDALKTFGKFIGSMWGNIKRTAAPALNWLIDKLTWIIDKINFVRDKASSLGDIIPSIPTPGLPGLPGFLRQTGGRVAGRNWGIVGERGPEMVKLPTGASIYPHGSTQPAALGAGLSGAIRMRTEVPVYLDGKMITRVVSHHTANDVARR